MVTAIVAGVLAAVFGGSHVQVSGPTGAMTVVLAPVVAKVGGGGGVAIVTIAAGVLLMAGGISRIGRFVRMLPWPVIEGFTVGIGLIIFLQQVPSALGVTAPDFENTALRAGAAVLDVPTGMWQAFAITALVAVLMTVIPKIHRTLPSSLIAVAAVTVLAELAHWPVARIGAIPASIPTPALPSVDFAAFPSLFGAIVSIAALAAIESLLSARVADGMSDIDHHEPDRELFGQGVANIGSALFGGMPATGAIARTAVNVRAGGRTRVSAIVHAALLLVVVVALAPVVAAIPLAALAGVLMVTAVHMIEFGTVNRILRSTRGDALVLVTTATATVVFDLVVAVEVGIVLAALIALHSVATASRFDRDDLSEVTVSSAAEYEMLRDHVIAYQLDGALFFGAAQRFLLELTDVSDVQFVILRLGKLRVLDATGAQAIGDLVARLQHRGITVLLACVRPEHRQLIDQIGAIDELEHSDRVVPTIGDALAYVHGREQVRLQLASA
jgi:SulP family sulfate permease